jgi:amino acid permease
LTRYAVGAVLLVLSAMGSVIGLHLLAVSQATAGIQPSSFYTVANAAMPSLTVLIDVAVYLKCKPPHTQPSPFPHLHLRGDICTLSRA